MIDFFKDTEKYREIFALIDDTAIKFPVFIMSKKGKHPFTEVKLHFSINIEILCRLFHAQKISLFSIWIHFLLFSACFYRF